MRLYRAMIYVKDLPRVAEFYGETLGLPRAMMVGWTRGSRIGPFKLTDHASHLNGLGGIELSGVRVVG